MRKSKQILLSLLALAGMATLPANAELNQKQVGTPNLSGGTTCYFPAYSMSKYGDGITIYQKDAIGLDSGVKIKEISFIGYQAEKDFTDATITVYLANTNSTNYKDFVVAGETEGGKATTVFDAANATLFYSGAYSQPAAGEKGAPVKIIDVISEEGFVYGGENLAVYVFVSTPKCSPYTYCYMATASGTTYKNFGGYRDGGNYAADKYPGYSIYTKTWSQPTGVTQVPVMTIGYEGAAQAISATVNGRVNSGLNNSLLGGATVEIYDGEELLETVASESNGRYSITVDEVDMDAVYTVKASKEGYESQSQVVDLKAGGDINDINFTLPKLAVPATLSGFVVNKSNSQPMAGVALSFNGANGESAEDGSYSFDIENVDLLPADGVQLTATANRFYNYSTSLRITEDMTFNIEMTPIAELEGVGTQVGEHTIIDYDYNAPFNTLWSNSITETIYPKSMLGNLTEGEKYSSITFYGYLTPSTPAVDPGTGDDDDDDDYGYGSYDDYDDYGDYSFRAPAAAGKAAFNANVTIYMVDTDDTSCTADYEGEDLSDYTKLYEGPVAINEGGSKNAPGILFTADLNKPYVYGGKNMKLIVVAKTNDSKLVYFSMDPTFKSNVATKYDSNADNLATKNWSIIKSGVPVFKLGAYVPTAEVSGVITDKGDDSPIQGVEVTLSYDTDTYSATTDEDGIYTIYVRNVQFDEDYALSVAYLEYNEINEAVSFTEEEMEKVFNFALAQEGEISGIITEGENNTPVVGATVTLLDGEEVIDTTTTDENGAYSFPFEEVLYHEYTVKVEHDDYDTATLPVQLTADRPKVDNAHFVLNDTLAGVSSIEAADDANRIYSVSGVMMNSDLNSLPKGVYIVGKKKVVVK